MIRPADRLANVSEYWFSKKLKEIAALRAEGADIISLAIGGPDLPPPAAAVDAAVSTLHDPTSHRYQMTVGIPALRRAFADWYARYYHISDLNPDTEILPLIGSKEGVLNVSLAFLNPGDKVLVPDPGYPTYTSASRIALADIVTYSLTEQNNWLPDIEALEKKDLSGVKLMWVNYPHMPTGTPADISLFEQLVSFGKRHDIVIVNDNPYSFILNDKPLSILSVPGARDICIELNSLSKCLNMSGWRVGMLASNPEFINWILAVKSNIDSGQPRAIMEGAVAALSSPDSWYRELNATYAARQKVAYRIVEALRCHAAPGQQGLFIWARIPDSAENSQTFAQHILDRYQIFITPGFIFGANGDRYIRISLCAPEETLTQALNRLCQ